jgi:hypothetical protein
MSYTDSLIYRNIPKSCTGKRRAFQNGWDSQSVGRDISQNPYDPRIKNQQPTNTYYKHWALGYECAQIARADEELRKERERFEQILDNNIDLIINAHL